MKKRTLIIIAAIMLMSTFTACATDSLQTSDEKDQQEMSEISQEDAKRIAFEDAKITSEKEVSGFSISIDEEERYKVYEVQFILLENNWKYNYEISAETGKILSRDIEENSKNKMKSDSEVRVSMEDAKKILLERVPGATEEDIRIKLDEDDTSYFYEGEIIYKNKEYEFQINAETGMILEWSEEIR